MAGEEAGTRGYQDVAREIREAIRTGEVRPGALLPTERELTDLYGVSRTTIRRALQALVESGWAISRPNRGVVGQLGPASNTSHLIAFVDHIGSVHQYLYSALGRLLTQQGFHLVHVDSGLRGTEGALELCVEQGMAAAVVWSKTATPDTSRIGRVMRTMPIVAVDHGLRGLTTDLVTNNVFDGAAAAVTHLCRMGRKRIAVSGMIDSLDTTQDRLGGYIGSLFANGLSPQVRDFLFVSTSGMGDGDIHLLKYRLSEPDRPDAILVLQDTNLPDVVRAVQESGLRIPEDVAVIGMGNEMPMNFGDRGMTSVGFDWDLAANKITECLTKRLRDPHAPAINASLPVRLWVRGSCGAPPETWDQHPYLESHQSYPIGLDATPSYRDSGTTQHSLQTTQR